MPGSLPRVGVGLAILGGLDAPAARDAAERPGPHPSRPPATRPLARMSQSNKNNLMHVIRLAQPSECGAVTACVRQAYAPYVERIGREPAPMTADYVDLIARGSVYVLLDSTDVRGVLVLDRQDDTLWIENVAVHPRHQHRGLGRQLLAFAEQYAQTTGVSELQLYTNELMVDNIALYQRLGYREVERREDAGFRRVFMRKLVARS